MAVYLDARKTSNRAALFNKRIVFRCGNYGRSVVSIVHKRATLRVRNTEQERERERGERGSMVACERTGGVDRWLA